MKKLFLFSTKLYYFWTLLPIAALLAGSIYLNDDVKSVFKLYPLIVVLIGAIIFIVLFFIRGILLSYDDARCVGLFSKKDYASFKDGYSLVVTVLKRGRLLVEVYGFVEAGGIGYDWYDADDSTEINLLRARTNGSANTLKRVLKFYGFEQEDIVNALSLDKYECETVEATLKSDIVEETRNVRITFKAILQNEKSNFDTQQ